MAVADWLKAKPGKKGTPPIFRLFGYAGTGKTTLARHIAEGVDAPTRVRMRETAPREHRLVCEPTAHGQKLPHQIEGMRLHHALHILGSDGWELAGIDPVHRTDEGPASVYLFKRPQ